MLEKYEEILSQVLKTVQLISGAQADGSTLMP